MLLSKSCRASAASISWEAGAPFGSVRLDRTAAVSSLLARIPRLDAERPAFAGPCSSMSFPSPEHFGLAFRFLRRPVGLDSRISVSTLHAEAIGDPGDHREANVVIFVALDKHPDAGAVLVWTASEDDFAPVQTGAGALWIARASCRRAPAFGSLGLGCL